jgi:hypothetical protein
MGKYEYGGWISMKAKIGSLLFALMLAVSMIPAKTALSAVTASPTSSKVLVGANVYEFDAYNIDGFNYFKLRDLAFVLNETPKRFSVDWDASKKAITLNRDSDYTSTGDEMAPKGAGNKTAAASSDSVYLGDKKLEMEAYNIDGYNYYKLRDLGDSSALNFAVEFYGDTNSITIFTTENSEYSMYAGKAGVLKNDAKLENPYVITKDGDGKDIVQKYDSLDFDVRKNDVVIFAKDENGKSRVMVAFSEAPKMRGYLNPQDISFSAEDIAKANQCVLRDSMKTYDASGKEAGNAPNGIGNILERKDGKILVQTHGGNDGVWISEKDLKFDFETVIVDIK